MAHGVTNISGARREGIYGKTTGATINLKDSKGNDVKPKQGEYIYMNETTQLLRDNPVIQEYDRTTPVQVVNSAYDTSGNGGRKLIISDDGKLICVLKDTVALKSKYYTSIDGEIWSKLSFENNITLTSDVAIENLEGDVFIEIRSNPSTTLTWTKINSNTGLRLGFGDIDTGQSDIRNVSISKDSNGHLHAAWASKNSTYPNSYNIRYSKSTDGGVTWANPTKITNYNQSGIDATKPSIVISGNNNPNIIYQVKSAENDIATRRFDGASWISPVTILRSSYVQEKPSATVDSNGVIHVAWYGKDSTDTTKHNIRYSKSTNNGASWSTVEKLTIGNTVDRKKPSIATDLSNNIYIAYEDDGTTKYLKNGGSWNSPVTISLGTDVSVCDNYKNFENPMTLFDGGADVKFYGKWTEGENSQVIPSVNDATSESELQTIDSGTLQSYGNTQKHYVGFKTNKAIGFTPF